ncbi:MAG: RlmE family RNA methyltransferase [Alphaproteobacteria bacterium]|nr:RlmE family RNA methyltransferase [Alphaproteobacteria bacterium]MBP7759089.1 RlmE family RNA methyltransferase [Alphaproteobacteria bacterium]MBP7762453.1 RlmE family RNA methyltransferase [Alphaproteobacteria bacterium]MBP7904514.1 RlmE family RNA methyltransferase [Alphaproteobacteria bacterium]
MSRNRPKTRVKTAKKRKSSSTRWLQRQLNDPYVTEAQKMGYRGRAAFKLKEIDEKAGLLKAGMLVVDLGAAPGGWCQVALEKKCKVVAIDLLEIDELPGVVFFQKDFMEDDAPDLLRAEIFKLNDSGLADVVLSDMAPNTIGHKQTDHLRIMAAVEAAYLFATEVLKPGGSFVAKVFQGGAEGEILKDMKKRFTKVKHIKPPASRKDSSEQYIVATGFKG